MAVPTLLLTPTQSRDRAGNLTPTKVGLVPTVPGQYATAWQVSSTSRLWVPTANHLFASQGELVMKFIPPAPDWLPGSGFYNDLFRAQAVGNEFLMYGTTQLSAVVGASAGAMHYVPVDPMAPMVISLVWKLGEKSALYIDGNLISQSPNVLSAPLALHSELSFGSAGSNDTAIFEAMAVFDAPLDDAQRRRIAGLTRLWTWEALQPPPPVIRTTAARGKTTISAELWRYTLSGEPLEDITYAALSGKVSMNSNADIKGVMSLKARALDLVTPFVDHLAPFLIITDAMGDTQRHQMGLYAIPPGKESHAPLGSTLTLEGRDVTWHLANSYPTSLQNFAAGTNVVEKVKDICTEHGLNVNIPASSKTLPAVKTFHVDKSWLQIANDLLNGIGYYTVWADRFGTVKSLPYFELAGAQPTLELYSGEGSMVINTIEQEGTYEGLANRIVVYRANTQGTPIVASRTNSDPMSPISTTATGRIVTRMITDSNLVDQAAADAMAKRYLEESASYTKKMKVATLPTPERDLHEVYDLAIYNDEQAVIAFGKWWCDQWECEIGFRPVSAVFTHHIKRLEPYGGDAQ